METLINSQERLEAYVPFRLTADLSRLSENEREVLPFLLEAAAAMEIPFWRQNYGEPDPLLASIVDADLRRYVRENYGPWARLHRDEAILAGAGRKPPGANFYPADMTPDGKQVVAYVDDELVLLDAVTGKLLKTLSKDLSDCDDVSVSPGGHFVYTNGEKLRTWNLQSGTQLATHDGSRKEERHLWRY